MQNTITDKQFEFISKEIEITYAQIDKQRDSTTEFLKIYFSILIGLFAYIYFIEGRLILNGKRVEIPNQDLLIFGLFGIVICSITFVIGWALLDNVTKAVYKSIKYYKHISHLRYLISTTFQDDLLRLNSLLPIKQITVPMRISAHVPIIGGILNFGLLSLNYYFFLLFLPKSVSLLISTLIMMLISIVYSNLLEKHFEEILIAQKLYPQSDEEQMKLFIKRFIKQQKRKGLYKSNKFYYVLSIIVFFIVFFMSFGNLEYGLFGSYLTQNIVYLPILFFFISVFPRYYMGKHRIKNIKCFE